MRRAESRAGYECVSCGRWHQFRPYVFAHMSEVLTHSCDCGAKVEILQGVATPVLEKTMVSKKAVDFAARLNGREMGKELSGKEAKEAKELGLIVIYGASDDLMEVCGFTTEELEAYEGTTASLCLDGSVLKPWDESHADADGDEEQFADYFASKALGVRTVEALFDSGDGYSFTYKTDVPHATFDIFESGDPYCRGIVIDIADLKASGAEQPK